MANIAKDLPTGKRIAAVYKPGRKGLYGAHCKAVFDSAGLRVDLITLDDRMLATVEGPDFTVNLSNIEAHPDTVPYVNRFLLDHRVRVETYWRTKQLRIVPVKGGGAVKAAPAIATGSSLPPVKRPGKVTAATTATTPVVAPAPAPVMVPVVPTVGTPPSSLTIDGIEYSVFDDGTTIPAKDHRVMLRAMAQRLAGKVASVLITGPSGTAKTVQVAAFARSIGATFITVQGLAIETASDWFGQMAQHPDGRWYFDLSPFGKALADGASNVVVLLDEANRAQSAAALNAVLSLLDRQGHVYVPGYGTLHMPKGLLVVVTANMGAEYVGVQQFDAAVRQRFAYGIRTGYLPEQVEQQVLQAVGGIDEATAKTLVAMAGQQRPLRLDYAQFPSGTGLSTRMLVDVAVQVAAGCPVREAMASLADAQFDPEDMVAFGVLLDSFFPDAATALFTAPSLDPDSDLNP